MMKSEDEVEIRKRSVASSNQDEPRQENEEVTNDIKLKKSIGPIGGISLVVGTMIGSGIFMSPASVTSYAGSVGASLCVWAGCGVLATMCAFTYMELGLMIRKSGGEYQYLKEAYGDLMAFLLSWTFILISKPSEFGIISLSFAEYVLAPFFPGCSPPTTALKCAAAFCILVITCVNAISVKASEFVQIFFTAAKLLLIFAIIIGGFVEIGKGNTQNLENSFEGTSASASAIALAFYYGLWSYDGWNTLNFVTEELRNPLRNFPLTILVGIPLVTVCYVLVNIAYFTVMTPAELIASNAVAVTFGDRVFGSFSWTVPVAVACSTFGAANGLAFTTARLTYAAGRNGHMLQSLSYISVNRVSPVPALIFNSIIGLLMLLPDSSNFETLINYFTFATWIFYGATFFGVIVLRRKHPDWKRPFKVWIIIPLLCTLASIYLIVAPIVENPSIAYLYAALCILLGLVVYFPIIYYNKQPKIMGPITAYVQMILEVVPPPEEE